MPIGRHLLAALAITVAVFWWDLGARLGKPMDDIDEAAVFYSTYYYYLAVHQRDFRSPEWVGRDALDHPPFWKYAHGIAWDLAGVRVESIEPKNDWHHRAWFSGPPSDVFLADMRRALPPPALRPGRLLSNACAAAASLAIFFVAAYAAGPLVGWLAWAVFAFNHSVRYVAGRAMIDALFVLLVVIAAALEIAWIERGPRRGRIAPVLAVALGVVLGAVVNTKINGVLELGAAGIALAILVLNARERLGPAALSFAVVVVSFLTAAIGLNPTLWRDPPGMFARMIETRWTIVATQQLLFDGAGLMTIPQAVSAFLERALLRIDPLWMPIYVPAFVVFFALGAVRAWRAAARGDRGGEVIFANALVWVLGTAVLFRINWARYTVPAIPWVGVIVAAGIAGARDAVRSPRSRDNLVAGALALSIGALIAIPRMWRRDPREVLAERVRLAERLLAADPGITAPREMIVEARDRAASERARLDAAR